jgi:glycosyltransferase involved in cell wall biosynthesis
MASPKKVLMLVENLSVPADPRVWREACALSQHGYQVSIICPKGETRDTEASACIDGIYIYRYRVRPIAWSSLDYLKEYSTAMIKTFFLSFKVLFKHGFDIIHAANPPDLFFVIALFYRLLGKKFIYDQHDLAPEMFKVKFQNRHQWLCQILYLLERCSYKTADLVITTNASQKHMAMQRGGCPDKKVFIVRNGPDLAKYAAVTANPALKRGRRYLLAYVGVMGSQDGVEYALQALAELVQRGRNDVSLVLMGDGDQVPLLHELTHELHLEDYVEFAGWVTREEMLRYLSVTDIGLSPDPSNELNDHSTMLKTMEYMAMRKPVVAFDLPETRISAQDAALYATPNRVTEFADCIETLLDDQELRIIMGNKGRKRVEEILCWERTQSNLFQAYHTLFPLEARPDDDGESQEQRGDDVSTTAVSHLV